MKRYFLFIILLASSLAITALPAAEMPPSFGIVNFTSCFTDSKFGKQEQSNFEALKKQMTSLLEETEQQLTDLSNKMNDPDYIDGLSPEAEEELKVKVHTLNEEMNRYQNQYYQVLNQAHMRIVQTVSTYINTASEKVAKDAKLQIMFNKEACPFYLPKFDLTSKVVAEMDKIFEEESKKQPQASTAQSGVAPQKTSDNTSGKTNESLGQESKKLLPASPMQSSATSQKTNDNIPAKKTEVKNQ